MPAGPAAATDVRGVVTVRRDRGRWRAGVGDIERRDAAALVLHLPGDSNAEELLVAPHRRAIQGALVLCAILMLDYKY